MTSKWANRKCSMFQRLNGVLSVLRYGWEVMCAPQLKALTRASHQSLCEHVSQERALGWHQHQLGHLRGKTTLQLCPHPPNPDIQWRSSDVLIYSIYNLLSAFLRVPSSSRYNVKAESKWGWLCTPEVLEVSPLTTISSLVLYNNQEVVDHSPHVFSRLQFNNVSSLLFASVIRIVPQVQKSTSVCP